MATISCTQVSHPRLPAAESGGLYVSQIDWMLLTALEYCSSSALAHVSTLLIPLLVCGLVMFHSHLPDLLLWQTTSAEPPFRLFLKYILVSIPRVKEIRNTTVRLYNKLNKRSDSVKNMSLFSWRFGCTAELYKTVSCGIYHPLQSVEENSIELEAAPAP